MEVEKFVAVVNAQSAPTPTASLPSQRADDPVIATQSAVKAPEESVSPVPSKLLNDEPLTMRLVVEAVRKDE